MLKRVLIFLFALAVYLPVYAQHDTTANGTADTSHASGSHLRISLLTCGPGEEIYETFGHSAIRVIDSTKTGRQRDVVYNYGFLDSSPDNTVTHQFLTGRIQVYLATNTIEEFNYQYSDEKRGVEEAVFLLSDSDKRALVAALENNALRQNRYYEYSSAYDNCCTRILGIFFKVFGNRFVPGPTLPGGLKLRLREFTDRCGPETIQHKYWFSTAMNILYGCRANKVATNTESMYIADYFRDGMTRATIDGHPLCGPTITIFVDNVRWPDVPDGPLILFWTIALVTIAGLVMRQLSLLGSVMSIITLLFTGLLGCCIIYFWAIDAEPGWKDNFNVLWALPTNLLLPFCSSRIKSKYSIVALVLIGVSLVIHLLGIQTIPLHEVTPLLLTQIFVFGVMYRKTALVKSIEPAPRR